MYKYINNKTICENWTYSKENNMTDKNLSEEGKLMSADGVSHVPTPVDGEGGKIKDRKADLKKKVDPTAETLPQPPLTEEEEKAKKENPFAKKDGDEDDEDKKVVKESESILAVFEGVELSEEAKHKLKVVFEAAVNNEVDAIIEARMEARVAEINEAHQAELDALKESHDAELASLEENLEAFAVDASNKWLEENKVAIQDSRTVEIAEALVNSMKDLFVEHEIAVDTDSAETIAALEEEIEASNARTNEAILESLAVRKELNEMKSEMVFAEISEGLSTSQAEKLRSLSKKLVKEDVETFKTDLLSIKETFFKDNIVVEERVETPIVKEDTEVKTLSEDFQINAIAHAINSRNFA